MRVVESEQQTYNERLFSRPGLRRFYHVSRFNWVRDQARRYLSNQLKFVELGCYDGRLLSYLKPHISHYVGIDANWAEGLDLARRQFNADPSVTLIEATDPSIFDQFPDKHFDAAAALETLEHVPPETMPRFLDQLARVTGGYIFITVPNELGPVFLLKYVAKRLRYGGGEPYSPRELIAAVLRKSELIERSDHKGFDYRDVIKHVARLFDVVKVEGIPAIGLPAALAPTVGIVAKSRSNA